MEQLPEEYNGIALTLIESISTLAVMGNKSEFSRGVRWIMGNLTKARGGAHSILLSSFACIACSLPPSCTKRQSGFDLDIRVNVFEANIRVVGGLLSAHFLATDPSLALMDDAGPCYKGELLALAIDMADRLLPAFPSASGVPYAWVNLRRGRLPNETAEQNTAGAGTFILEFGSLSAATGDPKYLDAAKGALRSLWKLRSPLHLLGN